MEDMYKGLAEEFLGWLSSSSTSRSALASNEGTPSREGVQGPGPRQETEPDERLLQGPSDNRQNLNENGEPVDELLSAENPQELFPTEAREREKRRKAAGIKVKKQKKEVEDHYDDLGDDLSGLGGDLALYLADTHIEKIEVETESDLEAEGSFNNFETAQIKLA